MTFLMLLISAATYGTEPLDCGIEATTPAIRKGEVKIAYACADFPVPELNVEKEVISFYDEKSGLILRSRVSKDDPAQKDVTIKFRPKDQSGAIELEKLLYESIKEHPGFKCEADVSYGESGNKNVNSCSLTTDTDDLTNEHQAFAQMTTGQSVKKSLSEFEVVRIESQSWKVKHASFEKGLSIERWDVKNKQGQELCILEVSAKFEVPKDPKADLPERLKASADAAMAKLLDASPDKKPHSQQGNKTGRALSFARTP